jgi:hypothetical protein
MDFRTRYKSAPKWTEGEFDRQLPIKIYQKADGLGIFQLNAPDRSTSFLVCFGSYCEATNQCTYFAIEAASRCSARAAFEAGKMSWIDFWSNKGWLLRLEININGGDVQSIYIEPDDLLDHTISVFKKHGNKSPYFLMREQYLSRIECAHFKGEGAFDEEREYLEFMVHHSDKFDKVAA